MVFIVFVEAPEVIKTLGKLEGLIHRVGTQTPFFLTPCVRFCLFYASPAPPSSSFLLLLLLLLSSSARPWRPFRARVNYIGYRARSRLESPNSWGRAPLMILSRLRRGDFRYTKMRERERDDFQDFMAPGLLCEQQKKTLRFSYVFPHPLVEVLFFPQCSPSLPSPPPSSSGRSTLALH